MNNQNADHETFQFLAPPGRNIAGTVPQNHPGAWSAPLDALGDHSVAAAFLHDYRAAGRTTTAIMAIAMIITMMIVPARADSNSVPADTHVDVRLSETNRIAAHRAIVVRRLRERRHGEQRSRNGCEGKRLHSGCFSWKVGADITPAARLSFRKNPDDD
jgi:hypothetical protein